MAVLVFALLLPWAHAQAAVLAYPGAELERAELGEKQLRTVYLSAPKRISNDLRFERLEPVFTTLDSKLYRLPNSVPVKDVFAYYQKQLSDMGAVAFQCAHRACGTSSHWANRILNVAKLTGRDDNQYYLAAKLEDAGQARWVSVYVVKNGRRQHYAYVQSYALEPEAAKVEQAETENKAAQLNQVLLEAQAFAPAQIDALKSLMLAKPDQLLLVQIYLGLGDSYSDYLQRSEAAMTDTAHRLQTALGLPLERFKLINAGPLERNAEPDSVYWRFHWLAP